MAIQDNNGDINKAASAPKPTAPKSEFEGASFSGTAAPTGGNDFLGLLTATSTNRIDARVEPYLKDVMTVVQANMSNCDLITLNSRQSAFVIRHVDDKDIHNLFVILFVTTSDQVSPQFWPASMHMRTLSDEIKTRFADKTFRLCDFKVMLSGYAPEIERADKMADAIVRSFRTRTLPQIADAQISSVASNEFVVDWRLPEVREVERELSPHGVPARVDFGLVLKAKIISRPLQEVREFDTEYRTMGVIGGYTDFREAEPFTDPNGRTAMLYRPVFNITVLNSMIPLDGIAAILLAALAPAIYNTKQWLKQWPLGEGKPNPGHLQLDPDKPGKTFVLANGEELIQFADTFFAQPTIVLHFQDGRDNIPGLSKMFAPDEQSRQQFINRLTNFFGTENESVGGMEMARIIETRFDGVYGDPRGTLHDSRDIDYLKITAADGLSAVTPDMRRTLMGGAINQQVDLARLVQTVAGSFAPLWLNTVAAINPEFIKWITSKTARSNLTITDSSMQLDRRPFGTFLEGFGSASGMGSIVTSGIQSRGLNVQGFWSN